MMELMNVLARGNGRELHNGLRIERNELQALGLSARAQLWESGFKLTGNIECIDKAIELRSQAVSLTPNGHVASAGRLSELGGSLGLRFERLGKTADVNKAIECHTQAVLLTPDGHAYKPFWLNNLGNSYQRRFNLLGELADVEKAIEYLTQAALLTPEGHANKPAGLSNLGVSYRGRFTGLGDLADLEKAIECQTQAVLLTPDDHADKPAWLNNLGISCHSRFEHIGGLADLGKAVECQTQAVMLTPDDCADRPARLSNLGNSYLIRFKCLGELADVEKAIECLTQAVLLTPDGHATKPALLNNLGNSYQSRYKTLGDLVDVEKAIECQTQAVLPAPDDHADKPAWLNNLGNSHRYRFERLGELTDVDKAVEFQTQAVLLTPGGHAHKPTRLNNLGNSCLIQFKRRGELANLEKAIECLTQAVRLTPDGHAHKPISLESLGSAYMYRFQCLGQLLDLESAHSSFHSAAQHIVTNPSIQIHCARNWAKLSSSLGISPLPAYERCMELIPHVIWLGTTIAQRYSLLATISDLAAEAAAWAISVQAYDPAIEWLEQGRSIVWNQILQLRTPFDDLCAVDPALAKRLKHIAVQLEGAGTRSTEIDSSTETPAELEKDAQRHRRLADEWEKGLADARSIPGLENFMQPRKAEDLKLAASDGPVVLINTHSTHCDALIIFPQCEDVAHLPLPDLSLKKAGEFRAHLYSSVGHRGHPTRWVRLKTQKPEDMFKATLVNMWSTIVKPILDALAGGPDTPVDELPHLTWCATGALTFLPIHAAGPHDGSSPNAYDLVISSYTPTLSALLGSSVPISPRIGLLAVGQEATPNLPSLPCTVQELRVIEAHAKEIKFLQLDGEKAKVDEVLRGMGEHGWVHLACHASQDQDDPAQSAFHLHDGNITLETITKRQFQGKGLAFLSACQTATGASKMPDEAVHLAAGMLMAGYPSVIATMWPICDADGPEVAERWQDRSHGCSQGASQGWC